MALWGSNTLREIGLVDILQDKIDCRLRFDKRTGCIIFSYMSDYEPPDEAGTPMPSWKAARAKHPKSALWPFWKSVSAHSRPEISWW